MILHIVFGQAVCSDQNQNMVITISRFILNKSKTNKLTCKYVKKLSYKQPVSEQSKLLVNC